MNELIFNGVNFTAFDAYYATSNFLDGAAKDYTSVSVLGRSGDLQISNNRYKNITVKVRVYVRSNMEQNIRAMRSYLESVNGYARLELSDQPNEYRIGLYKEMFAPSSYDVNVGVVDLTFDCKPQRYLKSGEIPVSASSQSVSYEGNPVEIDNPSGLSAVNSLSVVLNPSQELNGYDAPWVGGAGKNKLNVTATTETRYGVTFTVNDDGSVKVEGTPSGTNVFFNLNYAGDTKSIPAGEWKIGLLSDDPNIGLRAYAPSYVETAWGMDFQTVTVADDAIRSYVRIQIDGAATTVNTTVYPMILPSDETDTSFAPYENICPITGHSSVSVTRTGKNLYWLKTGTKRGLTLTANDNGTYTLTGTFNGTSSNIIGSSDVITLKAGTYILNSGVASTYYGTQIYNSDTSFTLAKSYGTDDTFTLSSDTNVIFRVYIAYNASMGSADVTFRPMLRLSGTTSDFEPYQSHTVTVDLNGTRYGGTLNVTTGVLTVDRAYKTVGEMTWTYNSSNGTFLTTSADGKKAGYLTMISDRYIPTNAALANMANGTIRGHATNATSVYIKDERYTDADTFKTAQADAQIVYELATPSTTQLTPQQISLLTGVNYISSSDEVTVTVTEPSLLENPTLFESKPLIRVYGNGVLTINNQYITIAENPYEYIDIDCEIMDAFYGANNANQYVSLPNDYITLKSGNNYIAYDGTVQITPRWYEV